MKIKNFLRTTALVSPVMMFALTPGMGLAEHKGDKKGDNIQITQSAATKDSLSNTATVKLDGNNTSIMAVGGSDAIAQSGDNNSADFDVAGDLNTIYFAQTGNSIVTMSVDGDNNLVTLNEFGGDERLASLNLSVSGDSNDVELSSNEMYAVAELLEINIVGSSFNVVKVTYDDYSEIVANILGSESNVEIVQNDNGYYTENAVASADINNSVTLLVSELSAQNKIYLSQYGYGSNAEITLAGDGNRVRARSVNHLVENNSTSNLYLDVSGNDNNLHLHQNTLPNLNERGVELSATISGNRNFVRANSGYSYGGPIDLTVAGGSDNDVEVNSDSIVEVFGSGNVVRHKFYSYTLNNPGEFSSFDTYIEGDNNKFVIASGHGIVGGSAPLLKVHTDIFGFGNNVSLNFRRENGEHGVYGTSVRVIDTFISGDENTITATDTINLGSTYTGNFLDFDILGNSNDIEFGNIGASGLEASINGKDNSMTFMGTDDAFSKIQGDNNKLSLIDTKNFEKSNYNIIGDSNSVAVENASFTSLDMNFLGDGNTATVSGVDELELQLYVDGMGNSYNQEMQDIYLETPFKFTVDAKMYGTDNSITVSSVPEYEYSTLTLLVDGFSNSLNVAGVGWDNATERSKVAVEILGDLNTVNVVAGPTAGLKIDGSNFNVDSTYDAGLSTYVNTISNVGSGLVTFTTADGAVSVDAT